MVISSTVPSRSGNVSSPFSISEQSLSKRAGSRLAGEGGGDFDAADDRLQLPDVPLERCGGGHDLRISIGCDWSTIVVFIKNEECCLTRGVPPTGKKSMRSLLDMPLLVVEVMEAALTAVTHWRVYFEKRFYNSHINSSDADPT